jgi:hypothetical protein
MKNTYEEAVLKTVMFWSDKSFRAVLNQNNGDNSRHGGLSFILMNMASESAKDELTDEKIKKFEDRLYELLMALENEPAHTRNLDVDYNPNRLLAEACKHAGVNPMCLPCKTWTSIKEDNTVLSKYQYGAKTIEL